MPSNWITTKLYLRWRSGQRARLLRGLARRLAAADAEGIRAVADIREAWRQGDRKGAEHAFRRLLALEEDQAFHFALLEGEASGRLFLTGSYFLHRCHAFLTAHPEGHERLHFVTGMRLGATLTLAQMVGLDPAEDSAIYARADQASVRRELIRMEEMGHSLHGLFHSHPGGGPSGTRPSGTDRATHERYERGGHSLVGAIFTKDGHVRFFSHAAPFHVAVFGRGARKVHENLFHLEATQNGSDRNG